MARNGTTIAEAIQLATAEIDNHTDLIEQIRAVLLTKLPPPPPEPTDWEYTLDDSTQTITLTKYIGTNPDVMVYNTYEVNGKTYSNVVIGVSTWSSGGPFNSNSSITSVTFAEGVTVENNDMSFMFLECSSLIEAPVIPSSVTNMTSTFVDCTSLTIAPTIPNGVTNMYYTFHGCTSLVEAPVIPSSVTNMMRTFGLCSSLTGILEINANPTDYAGVFASCSTNPGTDLVLTGSSTMLELLYEYRSIDSNIRIA